MYTEGIVPCQVRLLQAMWKNHPIRKVRGSVSRWQAATRNWFLATPRGFSLRILRRLVVGSWDQLKIDQEVIPYTLRFGSNESNEFRELRWVLSFWVLAASNPWLRLKSVGLPLHGWSRKLKERSGHWESISRFDLQRERPSDKVHHWLRETWLFASGMLLVAEIWMCPWG